MSEIEELKSDLVTAAQCTWSQIGSTPPSQPK